MPGGVHVTGLESDGADRFFCGGGTTGKVRTVRRPKQNSVSDKDPTLAREAGAAAAGRTKPIQRTA
jgi:hypothetical protein